MEYEAGPDGYGGRPYVATLLPHFGKRVACRIWVDGNVSKFNVYFNVYLTYFNVYLTYYIDYFTYFMLELKFMLEYI